MKSEKSLYLGNMEQTHFGPTNLEKKQTIKCIKK